MDANKAQRNVKLYYFFRIFDEPLFWGPILITYISRVSQMSLSQIYFMESICIVGLFLLEIPSGALADLLGRSRTIFWGSIFLFTDIAMFACAQNALMIWIANLLWVIGYSLISGAETSLLFDSLRVLGREGEFKKIEGRAISYRLALVALCSLSVGYLAEINLRLPLVLSAVFKLVFCFICFGFWEPPFSGGRKYDHRLHFDLMKRSVKFVCGHIRLRWIIIFAVLVGVVSKIWFFTYNPYFELVDLPIKYFGWIFFLLNVVAATFSYFSDQVVRKIGNRGAILLVVGCISVPIFLMGNFVCQLSALLVLMQNVARGLMSPFMAHLLHEHLDSGNRATVVSIKSAVSSFAQFVFLSLFGWVLGVLSLPQSLILLAIVSLASGMIMFVYYRKIFIRPVV